jgi:hypothetical protein
MPQAFGSFGAQVGTGSMLVRVATILFLAEGVEDCEVVAAPVRARTTTKARTIYFTGKLPKDDFRLASVK